MGGLDVWKGGREVATGGRAGRFPLPGFWLAGNI